MRNNRYEKEIIDLMSIDQYIAQLVERSNALESNFQRHVAGVGNDLLQMVQDRVQSRGVGADGVAFKDYTEEYKKRKKKQGRLTAVVDYTNTSRMWSNIQQRITQVSVTGNKYVTVIGVSGKENKGKFQGLTKRDGQKPTTPSKEEIQIAKDNLKQNIMLELFG